MLNGHKGDDDANDKQVAAEFSIVRILVFLSIFAVAFFVIRFFPPSPRLGAFGYIYGRPILGRIGEIASLFIVSFLGIILIKVIFFSKVFIYVNSYAIYWFLGFCWRHVSLDSISEIKKGKSIYNIDVFLNTGKKKSIPVGLATKRPNEIADFMNECVGKKI